MKSGFKRARDATVRVVDRAGNHRGQGLLLHLADEGAVVLTCHHVIAPLAHDNLYVCVRQPDGEKLCAAHYDAEHSHPEQDAVTLRIEDSTAGDAPTLYKLDPDDYPGPLDITGITRFRDKANEFSAKLGTSTELKVDQYAVPHAFRLSNPTDTREGISGSVVFWHDGVLGLTHFARSETPAAAREAYMVPLSVWAADWPALAKLIKPLDFAYGPGQWVSRETQHGTISWRRKDEPKPLCPQLPVDVRPKRFPHLIGREGEIDKVLAAFAQEQLVQIYGAAGVGKTSLLQHLAFHPQVDPFNGGGASRFRDGILYLRPLKTTPGDLLKDLIEEFYPQPDREPIRLTKAQSAHFLRDKRVLVMLDDLQMARDDLEEVLNRVPNLTFVLAATQCYVYDDTCCDIELGGLSPDDAVVLIERTLKRPLAAPEHAAAHTLAHTLQGHPWQIREWAKKARNPPPSLDELVKNLAQTTLAEPERRVLAALRAFDGAPLHAAHLPAIADVPECASALAELQARDLIEVKGEYYSARAAGATAGDASAQAEFMARALIHFPAWAAEQQPPPELILADRHAIMRVLAWGAQHKRWDEVQQLGVAIHAVLTQCGRWEAAAQVNEWVLQAARARKDRAGVAWALHQRGTRAMMLGSAALGYVALTKASIMRVLAGNWSAAATTWHNMNLLPYFLLVKILVPLLLVTGGGAAGYKIYKQLHKPTRPVGETVAPPPTSPPVNPVSFTVEPKDIIAGDSVQLCYEVQHASSIKITSTFNTSHIGPNEPLVPSNTDEKNCLTVTPQEDVIAYTLIATGRGGDSPPPLKRDIHITPRVKILSFTAQPNSVVQGVELCYQIKNATYAVIDPGNFPVSDQSGCVWVSPRRTTTYRLYATNDIVKGFANYRGKLVMLQTPRSRDEKLVTFEVGTGTSSVESTIIDDTSQSPSARPRPIIRQLWTRPGPVITGGRHAQLCYMVENATRVEIRPEVGVVPPTSTKGNVMNACRTVKVAEVKNKTTLHFLVSAFGRDGSSVSSDLPVVVVPSHHVTIRIDGRVVPAKPPPQ